MQDGEYQPEMTMELRQALEEHLAIQAEGPSSDSGELVPLALLLADDSQTAIALAYLLDNPQPPMRFGLGPSLPRP